MPSIILNGPYMDHNWDRYRKLYVFRKRMSQTFIRDAIRRLDIPAPSDEVLKKVSKGWETGMFLYTGAMFSGVGNIHPLADNLERIDNVMLNRKGMKRLSDAFMQHQYREAGYAIYL